MRWFGSASPFGTGFASGSEPPSLRRAACGAHDARSTVCSEAPRRRSAFQLFASVLRVKQLQRSDIESLLNGTPYLIDDDEQAVERFRRVGGRSANISERAKRAAVAIADHAGRVLPQFEIAVRADLVSESNRMEGIPTSAKDVRELARVKRDLLDLDVGGLLDHIRDDPRLLESLGLYRAYEIADEWAHTAERPREYELRALHKMVMPSLRTGGQYKAEQNEIGQSEHTPTEPWDVAREMGELASWFANGSGDAVLDAAVVHAWLAHIHPFDDGNGRMSRLMANLALVQAHYPPLLLKSQSDRGEYLDALAASDRGDILPLYDLFVRSLRRTIRTMERPDYVFAKIRGDLLASSPQRYHAWLKQAEALAECLRQKTKQTAWSLEVMGFPSPEAFDLLEERSPSGNCWFVKLSRGGLAEWLLWFGYRSDALVDMVPGPRPWPSIFFGERDEDPAAVHPFSTTFVADGLRPNEIFLAPGSMRPATVRWDERTAEMQIDEAAGRIVEALPQS